MFIKLTQIASCHLLKEHVPLAFVWWVENWLLYTQGKGIPEKEAHYSRLVGGNFRKQGNLLKASWAATRWVDLLTHLTHGSDSLQPHGLYSPWNFPGQNTGASSFPSPRDRPNPGIEPRSPSLQVDSLSAEPPGKPKDTGVGNLSLLQRIFPTQRLNTVLPHCRQILYSLCHQRSLRYADDTTLMAES